MRTITIKIASLKNLIVLESNANTFGEFHQELLNKSGELFDPEQVDPTKLDFIVGGTRAVYGQRDDAIIPESDFNFFTSPRQNKGAGKLANFEDFMDISKEEIKVFGYNQLRSALGRYNRFLNDNKQPTIDLSGSREAILERALKLYASDEDIDNNEVEIKESKKSCSCKKDNSSIINLEPPKMVSETLTAEVKVLVPDCKNCSYKAFVEATQQNLEQESELHKKNKKY